MTEEMEKSAEQLASESQLDQLVDDGEPGKEGPGVEENASVSAEDSLSGFLGIAAIAASFAGLRNTAAVWSEENRRALAYATVPVLRKYAWGQRIIDFLTTGAGVEEMALFAVAAPMLMQTVNAFREDTKKPEKEVETGGEVEPVTD